MNRITVMHMISSSFFGGPEKQILEHLKLLDTNKFDGFICSFKEGDTNELVEKAKKEKIPSEIIASKHPLDISAIIKIYKIIKSRNVNVVCMHGYKSVVLGTLVAKLAGAKTIAFSRGYTTENRKVALYEWLERKTLEFVNYIVAVSNGQKKKLESMGVKNPNIGTILNAVNVEKSSSKKDYSHLKEELVEKSERDKKIIVSAGRLSPEKGHLNIVKALSLLSEEERKKMLVLICGEGQCRKELETEIEKRSLKGCVKLLGFRRDVQDIFEIMDYQVLPSYTEGLPNVVLEGFSKGKTVIASNVGGLPELVQHNENGLLVRPGDVQELADNIGRLLNNNELLIELGMKAKSTVENNFSFEIQNKKLEYIYERIVDDERISI